MRRHVTPAQPTPTHGVEYRNATPADLPACGDVWRDALNDYLGRLNLPLIPPDVASIARLHAHLLATDPERFVVAVREGGRGDERDRDRRNESGVIAFGAAVRRGDLWFLSMLFVRPGEQGVGVGRALLARILPDDAAILGTATDSAQPISNALYASYGIVPRVPLLGFVGRPTDAGAIEPLPAGVTATPFEALAAGPPTGSGHRELVAAIDALDSDAIGFSHPQDHRFLRLEGRVGFLYRAAGGDAVGYGYTSAAGRVGPVAVRDPDLLPGVLGHLLTVIEPRGASAVWVAGSADVAVVALLRAGLRLDGFPVLLCWTRPFGDLRRYIPISPGLL